MSDCCQEKRKGSAIGSWVGLRKGFRTLVIQRSSSTGLGAFGGEVKEIKKREGEVASRATGGGASHVENPAAEGEQKMS